MSGNSVRLRLHRTAGGPRYRLERLHPSNVTRRGLWKPEGPLMSAQEAKRHLRPGMEIC